MRPLLHNGSVFEPLFVAHRTSIVEPLLFLVEPVEVRMSLKFSIQTIKKCSIFNPKSQSWSSSKCQTRTNWTSLDCVCSHESIYGIYSNNGELYFGFEHEWFYAAIGFQLFMSLVAIVLFVYRLVRKPKHATLSVFSVCSIQVLASHMLATVMYLITVILSPILNVDESGIVDASNSSCMVMAIVFHFTILLQFSSIFMNALLIYLILVKGYFVIDSGNKKKG